MLRFLKKLFVGEKEAPIESISLYLEEAEKWLADNSVAAGGSPEELSSIRESVNGTLVACQQNLSVLENASLKNDSVSLREKQIMDGNRTHYINRTRQLLAALRMESDDFTYLRNFLDGYTKEIEAYTNGTRKAFSVLQHFFANETRNITASIKSIDDSMQKLRSSLDANSVELINASRDGLTKLKEKALLKDYVAIKIQEIEEQKKEEYSQKEGYAQRIEKLKKSDGFSQYNDLVETRDTIMKDLREQVTKLEYVFSVLEKALAKYARQRLDEKVIKKYLFDPVKALLDDSDLAIADIFVKLESAVENDEVELKPQKKAKSLKALEAVRREKLSQFRSVLVDLKKKKLEQDRTIRGNVIMQEYNDLKYKHDHYEDRIKKHNHNIAQLQKKHDEIDLDALRSKVEEDLFRCTNVQVTLSLDKKPEAPEMVVGDDEIAEAAAEEADEIAMDELELDKEEEKSNE